MSIPSAATLAQSSAYVCRSCKSKLRAFRNVRLTTPRAISTASSTHRTPLPAWQPWRTTSSTRPNNGTLTAALRTNNARGYSTSPNTIQPVDSGIAPLPHRRLISLSGPDTVKLLQGMITNNVHADRNESFFAAFLDSRGRVLWDVFVWVYPELLAREEGWACYIEVDAAEAEALKKHLKRHKLRSKVTIELVPEEELEVWAAWGQAQKSIDSQAVEAELCDPRGDQETLWRLLWKPSKIFFGDKAAVQDEWQYHLQRYRQGIPEGPREIPRESALPMEVNIDLSHGIDFKKGCYLGQELTIRTKHTGVVRKRILPVELNFSGGPGATSLRPESGADIKQLDEAGAIKKGRAAGKFVASIGEVGLAMCRLEMMTPMRISAEGGSYKEGMEFGVSVGEGGHVVKVRPVLHGWFEARERALWAKSKPKSVAAADAE